MQLLLQQLVHTKQAQMDIKDVANSKLRKELHVQSVEASEATARLERQENSIKTTADHLSQSRQEVGSKYTSCMSGVLAPSELILQLHYHVCKRA